MVRNERNKQAKEAAEAKLKDEMKKLNELWVGGLDHVAANRKAKSVLFKMLGTEGQRLLEHNNPHLNLKDLKLNDFWDMLEGLFLRYFWKFLQDPVKS